jgi:hypothetical protein
MPEYKLFLPPIGYCDTPEEQELREENKRRNLSAVKAAGVQKPKMPITGSFIYAHPPNYKGAETINWDKNKWLKELNRLKSYGIDTVIFQAALWSELEECYYPSKVFSSFKCWNVIEPMLEAANELKFTIFLGGYGSVTCWQERLTKSIVDEEIARQTACFKELLKYRDMFHGFYFSPESAYTGTRNLELEKFLAQLYHGFFSEIRNADSKLKILMSPATFYYPETMNEMYNSWCEVFKLSSPDIIAPQDSIGCGCITLDHQLEALKIWHDIAQTCNIEHWSNVEVFDCCAPYIDEKSRCAANPDRIVLQMNNAANYVCKLITWELLYYANEELHPQGQAFVKRIFN